MRLAHVFCFLIIFGSSAVAAHAQTPVDPTIIIHGSPCVSGDYCIDLTFSGSETCFNVIDCLNPTPPPIFSSLPPTGSPLVFAADPPVGGAVIFPPPPTFTCEAVDLPGILVATYSGVGGPPNYRDVYRVRLFRHSGGAVRVVYHQFKRARWHSVAA